jgi:hypothetical protein
MARPNDLRVPLPKAPKKKLNLDPIKGRYHQKPKSKRKAPRVSEAPTVNRFYR